MGNQLVYTAICAQPSQWRFHVSALSLQHPNGKLEHLHATSDELRLECEVDDREEMGRITRHQHVVPGHGHTTSAYA